MDQAYINKVKFSIGETNGIRVPDFQRPVKPLEVAQCFEMLLSKDGDWSWSRKELAEYMGLTGTTLIGKFLLLLKLPEAIGSFIEWGRSSGGWIGYSSAKELGKCKPEHIEALFHSALKYKMTKNEIRSVKQLEERSKSSIEESVARVVGRRSSVVHKIIWIGYADERIQAFLSPLLQKQRDEWFQPILCEMGLEGVDGKVSGEKIILLGVESKISPFISKEGFHHSLVKMMNEGIN